MFVTSVYWFLIIYVLGIGNRRNYMKCDKYSQTTSVSSLDIYLSTYMSNCASIEFFSIYTLEVFKKSIKLYLCSYFTLYCAIKVKKNLQ